MFATVVTSRGNLHLSMVVAITAHTYNGAFVYLTSGHTEVYVRERM